MTENLFKFPYVMIDKDRGGYEGMTNKEFVIGEAEVPPEDFVAIFDRWLPTDESYERAQEGIFDACIVLFGHSGTWTCAWNKEKFKKKLEDHVKKNLSGITSILLNEKQTDYLLGLADKQEGKKDDEE